jgi:glycosyltransferase involved in cell wall biosynthesis
LPHSSTPTLAVVLKGYPRLSETFIAQELLGLERAGHALILFSMRHPTDAKRHPVHDEIRAPVVYLPEYLHHEPLRMARAVLRTIWRAGFWRATASWLTDLAREPTRNRARRFGQAVVLAAELPPSATSLYAHFIHTPAAVTRYAALISGRPWTCSAHAKDIWTSPDWDLRTSLASARWVTTCTSVGHRRLGMLAPAADRVHLIYHGLDLDRFPPCDRPPGTRDGSDPSNPVRLLSVGRAVDKKGFDTLVAALAQIPTGLAWRWTHLGGGGDLAGLQRQAAELGIADRIDWLGPQDQAEVLNQYRRADIFVLPCRVSADGDRDGLPNVLVEAQSQGLVCISTSISGVPELITDGVNGQLVHPDRPAALAAAIARLARDPQLRDAMGRAGAAKVRKSFDHRVGIAALHRLFETEHTGPNSSATFATAASEAAEP